MGGGEERGGFLRRDHVDHHAGAEFEPGAGGDLRVHVGVPVVRALGPVGGGVKHDVVCDVAEGVAHGGETIAQADADGAEVGELSGVQVPVVTAGDGQHLERGAAPVRADHDDAIVGVDDPRPGIKLGFNRRAQQTGAGESVESELLANDLSRNERQPEELPVGMLEGGAGFSAVVDDRLAVAKFGHRRMGLGPRRDRRHHVFGLLIVHIGPRGIVIGMNDENLVHAGRIGLGEDGAEVLDDHGLATLKGGVQVRDDEDSPAAIGPRGHQRGRLSLGPAGAERARTPGIGLDLKLARLIFIWSLASLGVDCYPASGQRIKSELTHLLVEGSRPRSYAGVARLQCDEFFVAADPHEYALPRQFCWFLPVFPIQMNMHYLDLAATTPMHPAAIDAMVSVLRGRFGNPSGVHDVSGDAREVLESARDEVASLFGRQAREIVFTGGGTEAINLALRGVLSGHGQPVILSSAIEHDAVRETADWLSVTGQAVHETLPVNAGGVLDLDAASVAIARHATDAAPLIVAVMAVNNEVGTIQPIAELAATLRNIAPGSFLVVDAVQAPAWMDLRPIAGVADFVAISAHKFGGPKGVGALYVREGISLTPLIHGGGQERERRSGTQNVAGIVGMAEAALITEAMRAGVCAGVAELRDRLVDGLVAAIDGCAETVSDRSTKVAGNAHLTIDGIESEAVLVLLNEAGIAASAGSACASGALHVSPVLLAMGVAKERAGGALRLTLGATSTGEDVDAVLTALPPIIRQLRSTR